MTETVCIGTRGSALARWQTDYIADSLRRAYPDIKVQVEVISTRGDRILDTPLPLVGGKGLFTAELEAALRMGEIDLAVHSLKDLPTDDPEGLIVGAIPRRADPRDVVVSRSNQRLAVLPAGATVGTSSRRRAAQVLQLRPDLEVIDIRGNVDTRIAKALDEVGPYDAIVLARAGLERLNRLDVITEILPFEVMLPAPGQGALGIQCRDEVASLDLLAPLNHWPTRTCVTAERAFLNGLGGGCAVPIAAYGSIQNHTLSLRGRVGAVDGSQQIAVGEEIVLPDDEAAELDAAQTLGNELARRALERGARALLETLP